MAIPGHEAVRRLLDLDFRDARSVLDLTYARGGLWRNPLPPGITLETNNIDSHAATDHHVNFTALPFPDGAYDLVVLDPPHIADGGKASLMAARFGTVRGTAPLRALIQAGCGEAWRVARVGVLVKVADHEHEGRLLQLSRWVEDVLGPTSMFIHTVRRTKLIDSKWKQQRSPRCNYATYLSFRKDRARHRAWRIG